MFCGQFTETALTYDGGQNSSNHVSPITWFSLWKCLKVPVSASTPLELLGLYIFNDAAQPDLPVSPTFTWYSRQQDRRSGRRTCQGAVIQTPAAAGIKGHLRGKTRWRTVQKLIHHRKRENRSWCSLKALSAVKTGGSQGAALSTAIMEQTSINSTVTDAHTYLHSALTACFLHFTTSSLLVVGSEDKPAHSSVWQSNSWSLHSRTTDISLHHQTIWSYKHVSWTTFAHQQMMDLLALLGATEPRRIGGFLIVLRWFSRINRHSDWLFNIRKSEHKICWVSSKQWSHTTDCM